MPWHAWPPKGQRQTFRLQNRCNAHDRGCEDCHCSTICWKGARKVARGTSKDKLLTKSEPQTQDPVWFIVYLVNPRCSRDLKTDKDTTEMVAKLAWNDKVPFAHAVEFLAVPSFAVVVFSHFCGFQDSLNTETVVD